MITGVVYTALATPAGVTSAVGSFKAALLYVANWYFIRHSTDYFTSTTTLQPRRPLLVARGRGAVLPAVADRLHRDRAARPRASVRTPAAVRQAVVALGALASMLWALHLAGPNLDRAYYGTDSRAYQMLAGALIALSPGLLRRAGFRRLGHLAAIVAIAALLVLATTAVDMGPIGRGIATMVVTVVLIVAMERDPFRTDRARAVLEPGRLPRSDLLRHLPLALADHRVRGAAHEPPDHARVDVRDLRAPRHRARVAELHARRAADPRPAHRRPSQPGRRRGRPHRERRPGVGRRAEHHDAVATFAWRGGDRIGERVRRPPRDARLRHCSHRSAR